MLDNGNLIAFVATTKPEDSRRFYRESLGLMLMGEDPQTMIFDANGTTLRVQKVKAHTAPGFTTLGWEVADIVSEIHGLVARGVRFVRVDGLDQDRDGIWTAKDGTMVAWFKDPDGNLLSLSEHAEPP